MMTGAQIRRSRASFLRRAV